MNQSAENVIVTLNSNCAARQSDWVHAKTFCRVIGVVAQLATSILLLGANQATADTSIEVRTSGGMNVIMVVEGKGPRLLPKPNIIVCSDGAQDDVRNLTRVANEFFPAEKYTILDGAKLPAAVDASSATFVFFGEAVPEHKKSDCLDRAPGFVDYIRLSAKLNLQQMNDLRVCPESSCRIA